MWVYSDDGGFKQVQDEAAVKEAEEKYRDVILDIQEAEIDKQIEALEKQKEALEENTKILTELEQNIQDAMTVEQAKSILGIVEDADLLNLSESEKQQIISGLADLMNQKDIEDNKDNSEYKSVTTDDILKSMGATVSTSDLQPDFLKNITNNIYDSTIKAFADKLGEYTDKVVNETINNGNAVNNYITNNIYDASDNEKIRNRSQRIYIKICGKGKL